MSDSTETQLAYQRVSDLIRAVEGQSMPAQLHGAVCGHLCAGQRWSASNYLAHALELLDHGKAPGIAEKQTLVWLYENAIEELQSEDMSFMPLLAEDDSSLADRLYALIQWISAFLTGFGSSGQDFSNIPEEVREILQDLADVSQVEVTDDTDVEDDWYTIVEHVRLSAVHLYLAYNEPEQQSDQPTTH